MRLLTLSVFGAAIIGCAPTDEAIFGLGEPCLNDGCPANLVCDDDAQTCRLPITCDLLACVAHQICDNLPGALDEACLARCEPGWLWDAELGACEQAPADCDPDSPRSIADRCAAQNRQCILTNLGRAECGPCAEGFVNDGGDCRARITCAEKQPECDLFERDCVEPDDGGDAVCAPCPAEQSELADGTCVTRTCALGARGSVGDSCAADFRTCVDDDALGVVCGECLGGYVEDPTGACRAVRLCGDQDCTLRGRTCVEGDARTDAACGPCRAGFVEVNGRCEAVEAACDGLLPDGATALEDACAAEDRACADGACVGCVEGFVLDPFTGVCRAPIPCDDCAARGIGCVEVQGVVACDPAECADLNRRDPMTGACVPVDDCAELQCAPGEVCSPASGNADAYCRRDCGERGVWNGADCAYCPPCDGPGDTGRVFPRPTANGECICETREGYFVTRGVQVASFDCDGDGDGWLRESARPAMRSLDPVIKENARCALRTVDAFELVNEAGTPHVLPLDRPLDLYESDRNDDDVLLARTRILRNFDRPFGAAGDLRLEARHLNGLTKYCHLLDSDYNDNGVPDVEDWGRRPPAPGRSVDQAILNRYSYFAELHQGAFRPSDAAPNRGRYVISEKRRVADGPVDERVPLTYGDDADAYWRECRVERDTRFGEPGALGMDFAEVIDDGQTPLNARGLGMNHHSQFKCVVVAETDETRSLTEIPRSWTPATHVVNDCRLDSLGDADGNPADAGFVCRTAENAYPGQVRWSAVPFDGYANDADKAYVRGCLDECAELRAGRLGVDPCDFGPEVLRLPCAGDDEAFGRLICYEACDLRDNDGNGVVDDPPPGFGALGTDCDTGRPGACALGSVICDADGVYACRQQPNAVTGARAVDVCDGLDNDCDGISDEDSSVPLQQGELFAGLACTAGEHIGDEQLGECGPSQYACVDGALICPQLTQPAAEVCDGLDNDCDGTPDNGLRIVDPEICLDAENTCLVQGALGICQTGVTACQLGALGHEEACAALIRPGEVQERCNGLDDDCDGIVDERPENGVDACARTQYFEFGTPSIPESAGSADDDFGGSDIECTGVVNVRAQGNSLTVSTSITLIEADDPGDSTRGRWGASRAFDVGAPIAEVVSLTQTEVVIITEDESDSTPIANGQWTLDVVLAGLPQAFRDILGARIRLEEGQAGNPVDYMRIRIGDDLPDAGYWVNGTIDYRIRVTPGLATCGNGIVEVGETCDDGNLCPGDGCSPACLDE